MTYTTTINGKKIEVPDRTYHFHCDRCGLDKEHTSDFTTGYGTTPDDKIHCWDCCALDDQEYMIENGRISLYLTMKDREVKTENRIGLPQTGSYKVPDKITNWPGSLEFKILSWGRGDHNWGIPRYDVWFKGPDGRIWWGRHQGNWTQIIHCRRTKHTGYAGHVARRYLSEKEQSI